MLRDSKLAHDCYTIHRLKTSFPISGESPERVSPPSSPQRGYDDAASKAVVADLIKHVEDQVQQEPPVFSEESKPTGPDVLQEEEIVQAPVVVTVTDEKDEIVEIEDVANDEVEKTGDGADRAAGAEHDEEENKRSKVGRKESWLVKKLKKVRRKSSSGSVWLCLLRTRNMYYKRIAKCFSR